MIEVPVVKAFTYEGRAQRVGDTIALEPLDAAILARRGFVSLSRNYRAAEVATDEAPKRRRYRRRDMQADA